MIIGGIILLGMSVLLLILAYCVKYKKAYWLISGYNTMSAEKKKNVDTKALGDFIWKIMSIMSAIIFVSGVLMLLKLQTVGIIAFLLILPLSLYLIIRGQKFDGNNYNENGSMKKGSKAIVSLSVIFTPVILIGVAVVLILSAKPATYTIENSVLNISGMYGQKIQLDDIKSIELRETLPEIIMRTNGSALGTKLKGNFKLSEIGKAKLFLDKSKPPFIYVETGTGIIIFNTNDSSQTKEFYEELKTKWDKTLGK